MRGGGTPPSVVDLESASSRVRVELETWAMQRIDVLRSWAQEGNIDEANLGRVRSALEAGGLALPGLDVQPFYHPAHFDWTGAASANTARLAEELDRLDGRLTPHPESEVLVSRGYWRAFFLWRGGRERTANAQSAPTATQVTGLAPGGGAAGNSYFSVLGPGTAIRAHTGQFNGRLRCHIGLSVPDGAWMDVAGERREWRVGECLVFSDALPHHVANDGLDARAVFAFDFWHPDVTPVERAALSMLLTSY
jgi:aspartyl/asparaginyl beta-hydroxylase (cupin superfamily)